MQLTDRNGSVIYFPGFFDSPQDYFNHLKTACAWQAEEVKVFGKWHTLARQTAWYGTADYRYAGQIKTAQPWLPSCLRLRRRWKHSRRTLIKGYC